MIILKHLGKIVVVSIICVFTLSLCNNTSSSNDNLSIELSQKNLQALSLINDDLNDQLMWSERIANDIIYDTLLVAQLDTKRRQETFKACRQLFEAYYNQELPYDEFLKKLKIKEVDILINSIALSYSKNINYLESIYDEASSLCYKIKTEASSTEEEAYLVLQMNIRNELLFNKIFQALLDFENYVFRAPSGRIPIVLKDTMDAQNGLSIYAGIYRSTPLEELVVKVDNTEIEFEHGKAFIPEDAYQSKERLKIKIISIDNRLGNVTEYETEYTLNSN